MKAENKPSSGGISYQLPDGRWINVDEHCSHEELVSAQHEFWTRWSREIRHKNPPSLKIQNKLTL